MQQLDGTIRSYPWGSRTMMARLQGRPCPTERPEAELWFGAHPMSPSTVGGNSLLDVIAEDPVGCLGERVSRRFNSELPFLLKILAAEEPLSLQAHPSLRQAREGFARENEAGIELSAPQRNYRDANHKPELAVALTTFTAMAGFRPITQTRDLLRGLECPALERYITMLDTDPSDAEAEEESLRALLTTWITIPTNVREELLDAVMAAVKRRAPRGDWTDEVMRNVLSLNERYPGDSGILGALLLNHVTLQPGEAIHLAAGQLHAYIHGLGVEIQANSDNVLRGGLTSKYVDVPELVRVLNFHSLDNPRTVPATDETQSRWTYEVPIPDFLLHRIPEVRGEQIDEDGPVIALCTGGRVHLDNGEETVDLGPGEAAWIPAKDPAVWASGGGELFIATA